MLFRDCENCENKFVLYNEFNGADTTVYEKWIIEKLLKVVRGKEKTASNIKG